jgi:hypothetical protein
MTEVLHSCAPIVPGVAGTDEEKSTESAKDTEGNEEDEVMEAEEEEGVAIMKLSSSMAPLLAKEENAETEGLGAGTG